jgi:hypothetical protein
VPATRLNAAAFVLETGTVGPVLVAATTAELTELSVLDAVMVEVAMV